VPLKSSNYLEKMGKYAKVRFESAKAQKDQRESNACFMVFRNLNTEALKAYRFTLTTYRLDVYRRWNASICLTFKRRNDFRKKGGCYG